MWIKKYVDKRQREWVGESVSERVRECGDAWLGVREQQRDALPLGKTSTHAEECLWHSQHTWSPLSLHFTGLHPLSRRPGNQHKRFHPPIIRASSPGSGPCPKALPTAAHNKWFWLSEGGKMQKKGTKKSKSIFINYSIKTLLWQSKLYCLSDFFPQSRVKPDAEGNTKQA